MKVTSQRRSPTCVTLPRSERPFEGGDAGFELRDALFECESDGRLGRDDGGNRRHSTAGGGVWTTRTVAAGVDDP